MKHTYLTKVLLSVFLALFLFACEDDVNEEYDIDLKGTPEVYESVNEKGNLEIPVQITCEAGLKKAFYKTVDKVIGYGKPVVSVEKNIPVSGTTLDTVLEIPVTMNLYQIVIAVYDNNDVVYLRTVKVEEVKKAPELTFKNGIRFKKTVMVGVPFKVEGNVSSENELKQISYTTVVNNQKGNPVAINPGDKKNVNFSVDIPVANGLQFVLFEAENEFGGIARDTFSVANVITEDFITVTIDLGITELKPFIANEKNMVMGNVTSWSDIKSLKYSIVRDGIEGAQQIVSLGDNPGNDYNFNFKILGEQGMEKVNLYAENNQGKKTTVVLPIPRVYERSEIKEVKVNKSLWNILSYDSQHNPYVVTNVIDDVLSTFWHTPYNNNSYVFPHWFIVDMGEDVTIATIEVFRRQGSTAGPTKIQLLYSQNGTKWSDFGVFPMKNNTDSGQKFYSSSSFPVFPTARYVKFVALEGPNYYTMIGELSVYYPEY